MAALTGVFSPHVRTKGTERDRSRSCEQQSTHDLSPFDEYCRPLMNNRTPGLTSCMNYCLGEAFESGFVVRLRAKTVPTRNECRRYLWCVCCFCCSVLV